MSICFGCGSKFGFFKKEYSCSSCGRLHCKKCLKNEILLPSKEKQEVCRRCYDAHKNIKQKNPHAKDLVEHISKKVDPPNAPPPYPGQHDTNTVPITSLAIGGKKDRDPDAEIKQRLENLKKEDSCDKPSEHGEKYIHERFVNLTGREPMSANTCNVLTPHRKLTEQEEIEQLMKSATAEAKLDQNHIDFNVGRDNANENIEERLLKLKGIDSNSVKKSDHLTEDDSSDEEGATAKIVRKALAEARIDEKVVEGGFGELIERKEDTQDLGLPNVPSTLPGSIQHILAKDSEEEEEELPWCCICNENAILRCHGCDDDLYCRRCFREGHSRFSMDNHKTSPFKLKRNVSFSTY